jgi:hypothetical protein
MGKFYENLVDLAELVEKLDKKDKLPIFILRAIAYTKENPELPIHEIIKTVKKEKI